MSEFSWRPDSQKPWIWGWLGRFVSDDVPTDLEPGSIRSRPFGSDAIGRALLQGTFLFNGERIRIADNDLWALPIISQELEGQLHGFDWIGDLAVVGSREASSFAQGRVLDWIGRHKPGRGISWHPSTVSRRLIAWVRHSWLLLTGCDDASRHKIIGSVSQQVEYLRVVTPLIADDSVKLEVIVGRIFAAKLLNKERSFELHLYDRLAKVLKSLLVAARSRTPCNPVEWLMMGILLSWVIELDEESGLIIPQELKVLSRTLGNELNGLCHVDGRVVHLNGGHDTSGEEARRAIWILTRGQFAQEPFNLGYGKILGNGTSVIVDAAHAEPNVADNRSRTLPSAFELMSNNALICANPGYKAHFEKEVRFQAEFMRSHNVLMFDGKKDIKGTAASSRPAELSDSMLLPQHGIDDESASITVIHDAYIAAFGYYHQRKISVSHTGVVVSGTDSLFPNSEGIAIDVEYTLYFNFHYQVVPVLSEDGTTLHLRLTNGELWEFDYRGKGRMSWGEGIYVNARAHEIATTRRLEIKSTTGGQEAAHRWWFRRLERAEEPRSISELIDT